MTIPFISVYKLTSRTPRSFSKIKLFAQHISLLTFLVFVIAEEVNIKLNMIEPNLPIAINYPAVELRLTKANYISLPLGLRSESCQIS